MKKKLSPPERRPQEIMARFDRLLAAMAPKAAPAKAAAPPKARGAKRRRTAQTGKARTK